jgi:hypothetical protein
MTRLTRTSTYPRADASSGALLGDGFVPDRTLVEWLRLGRATLEAGVLVLDDGRSFGLRDALRILGRRDGESDPYGYTGRVFELRELLAQGALIAGDGVRVGHVVYDSELGVHAEPRSPSASPPAPLRRPA